MVPCLQFRAGVPNNARGAGGSAAQEELQLIKPAPENELLEPKESTKERKKKCGITIGSKNSGTWKNGGLVRCPSLLPRDRPGGIYLRLTNNTAKPQKLNEL